jgi:hypothetical protein
MLAKSIGSSISGGKPPLRVASARIWRANGKQHARAFHQHDGMQRLLGNVLQPEDTGVEQVGGKHRLAVVRRLGLEVKLDLELVLPGRLGIHVDLDVDLGLALLGQRLGRVRDSRTTGP